MEGDFIKINKWLLPLSWLYGIGVKFRNLCFETGILKSRSFDIPVISVGNITVGGTGKTPHVEYLTKILQEHFKVAILSRGYKRKTKGFVLANEKSTVADIGDEPRQMKKKYPHATIAVDSDRCHGIDMLGTIEDTKDIDVVVLDDAFQHRYITPGINILLVDYHRLIIYDELLPAGRLREPLTGKNRADIVIVTKCPTNLKPMEFRVITKAMNLYPYQKLYFTTLEYQNLVSINADKQLPLSQLTADMNILVLSGIASPQQMMIDLKYYTQRIYPLTFSDHHPFKAKDIELIRHTYENMPSPKIIITTEKDAVRLEHMDGLGDDVRSQMYVLPLEIKFLLDQNNMFNQNIIDYVRKNSRDSILAQAKDDNGSQDCNHSGNRPRTISFRNYRQTRDPLFRDS